MKRDNTVAERKQFAMQYEKSCGAVIYTVQNGTRFYLVEQMQKGHVSLCKGHVEKDETELQTAEREIREETDLDVEFVDRHIVAENPTAEDLQEWHAKSGLPLKRFFNTSGQVYRNNGIKDKLPGMSEEEQYALLATDGMLVKRPIVVGEDFVLVGFKEKEWKEKL